MNAQINAMLAQMSKEEVIEFFNGVMYDQHTGYMLGSAAVKVYGTIESGKTLLYVDMCNVHACNHKFSTAGTNARWIASFGRKSDKIFKYGGDEFVILLDNEDVDGFVTRLIADMRSNEVYAVIGIVTTSDSLVETVDRADVIVMAKKTELENAGLKSHRDAPYVALDSHIVTE